MDYLPKYVPAQKPTGSVTVEDLGLSSKAIEAVCWVFMGNGVVISRLSTRQATLQTLVENLTIKDLRAVPRFSEETLRHIQARLSEHNLRLRQE